MRLTKRLRAATFEGCCGALGGVVGGEAAVQQTRHGEGIRGEKVVRPTTRGSWATAFRDNEQRAVLLGAGQQSNAQWGAMQRCVCILFAHGHGRDSLEGGGGSQ